MSSVVTTLTMSALINRALTRLHAVTGHPRQVAATAAIADNDTTITVDSVAAANIAATDVLEFGRELMLVTARSGSTITVSRGYLGTTAAAHALGALGGVNPMFPRYQVDADVRACITNSLDKDLPKVTSQTMPPLSGNNAEAMRWLDEEVVRVLDVRHMDRNGRIGPLQGRWDVEDWLPSDASPTGKALKVPRAYWGEDVIVTYTTLYSWTGSGETATIALPALAGDLPVQYAVAMLRTGREVSRDEFDQIEEWPAQTRNSRGADLRLLQTLWGQYFQQLDAAIGMQNLPMSRPFRKMARRL